MKYRTLFRTSRTLTVLCLLLSSGVALAQKEEKAPKPTASPKSTTAPVATPSPKSSATPTPAPTPETKIDAKMEAELLQAEDRFVNAIRNRDAKALDEILHPLFADAIDGSGSATTKKGVLMRVADGRLPAYSIEKERKIVRSGISFTVEGLGRDVAHELTEDHSTEEWAFISRIWTNETGKWIATAQTVKPFEEEEARERLEAEKKREQEPK